MSFNRWIPIDSVCDDVALDEILAVGGDGDDNDVFEPSTAPFTKASASIQSIIVENACDQMLSTLRAGGALSVEADVDITLPPDDSHICQTLFENVFGQFKKTVLLHHGLINCCNLPVAKLALALASKCDAALSMRSLFFDDFREVESAYKMLLTYVNDVHLFFERTVGAEFATDSTSSTAEYLQTYNAIKSDVWRSLCLGMQENVPPAVIQNSFPVLDFERPVWLVGSSVWPKRLTVGDVKEIAYIITHKDDWSPDAVKFLDVFAGELLDSLGEHVSSYLSTAKDSVSNDQVPANDQVQYNNNYDALLPQKPRPRKGPRRRLISSMVAGLRMGQTTPDSGRASLAIESVMSVVVPASGGGGVEAPTPAPTLPALLLPIVPESEASMSSSSAAGAAAELDLLKPDVSIQEISMVIDDEEATSNTEVASLIVDPKSIDVIVGGSSKSRGKEVKEAVLENASNRSSSVRSSSRRSPPPRSISSRMTNRSKSPRLSSRQRSISPDSRSKGSSRNDNKASPSPPRGRSRRLSGGDDGSRSRSRRSPSPSSSRNRRPRSISNERRRREARFHPYQRRGPREYESTNVPVEELHVLRTRFRPVAAPRTFIPEPIDVLLSPRSARRAREQQAPPRFRRLNVTRERPAQRRVGAVKELWRNHEPLSRKVIDDETFKLASDYNVCEQWTVEYEWTDAEKLVWEQSRTTQWLPTR